MQVYRPSSHISSLHHMESLSGQYSILIVASKFYKRFCANLRGDIERYNSMVDGVI
jgi:hypothetical protein